MVFAVTDRDANAMTAFVVEADRPGFSIGGYEHKLGIKGSPTGSPVLDYVRVPHENVIGEVGPGMRVAPERSNAHDSVRPPRRLGSPRARSTMPFHMRRSGSRSTSRSSNCRASNSS